MIVKLNNSASIVAALVLVCVLISSPGLAKADPVQPGGTKIYDMLNVAWLNEKPSISGLDGFDVAIQPEANESMANPYARKEARSRRALIIQR